MRRGWMTLGELIGLVRANEIDKGYHVYAADDLDPPRSVDAQVYVARSSTFDDDVNETFPEDIIEKGLGDFCSFALLNDVMHVALKHRPEATDPELVQALDYFMENDAFLPM